MAIRWDDWQLATGVESVDEDHKVLFEVIDRLVEASQQRDATEAAGTFDFLQLYTRQHFAREEAIMARVGCAMARRNAIEHREFEAQLAALGRDLEARGADQQFAEDVQRLVCDWLITHVMSVDKALADPSLEGDG